MAIAVIGENCSGKSALAEAIKKEMGAEIISGRDYLRMSRSESEAASLFREKLRNAVLGENIAYAIAEPELAGLLPDGAVRILVYADLDTIKERFRARMRGTLPAGRRPAAHADGYLPRPVSAGRGADPVGRGMGRSLDRRDRIHRREAVREDESADRFSLKRRSLGI